MMDAKHSSHLSNRSKQFKRSTLAVMIMAASGGALAQDSQEIDEEVLVRGIRSNIADAAAMKKEATTHIDAISAADIGSLPDSSVLEAVQRIPGISIERFAAADDPDHYSVEGSGLTLRGLPQTRSEFNGRDSFSANSGRGLTFQDVSPELMGSVEVIKNFTADMVEGGISGTVNLNTRKPFEIDERVTTLTVTGNYSDYAHDSISDATPSYSGLFSNVFEGKGGKYGLLISHADSDLDYRTDGFEAGPWEQVDVGAGGGDLTKPSQPLMWAPVAVGVRTMDINRDRIASSAVFQFENTEGDFDLTAEYFNSESIENWRENALYRDELSMAVTDDAVYRNNAFVSGTLTHTDAIRSQVRRSNKKSQVEDISVNLNWQVTDALKLSFDFQSIDAKTDQVDLSVFGAVNADAYVDLSSDIADVTFFAPGSDPSNDEANVSYFSDPENYFHQAAMDHIEESGGDEQAYKFDALYDIDNDYIDSVQTGVRFAERDQTTRWSTYNWAVLSEGWHGDGRRVYFNGVADEDPWDGEVSGPTLPGFPDYDSVNMNGFFRGRSDSGVAGGVLLSPNFGSVDSYADFQNFTGLFPETFAGLTTRGSAENPLVDTYYLPAELNKVTEANSALYVRVNFSDASDRLTGNVGLRYVSQDTTTAGGVIYPTPFSDNVIPFLDPDIVAFSNGGFDTRDAESSHSTILPSLNLRYEVADDMFVRFAASQSIAYPDTGLLRYSYPISKHYTTSHEDPDDPDSPIVGAEFDNFDSSAGNPFLKPMESDNFDLSWEWYLSDATSIATGVFYKNISNFFATDGSTKAFTNNGSTQPVDVYGPVNSGDGKLSGFELAYNQFWDNGLGVQFNYTYLKDENIPNQNTRSVEIDDGSDTEIVFDNLPLQGMSDHTYNLAGIYEANSIRARLAYNYRSEYMLTQRQVNLEKPVFSEAVGMLDGSIFYEINDMFDVGFTINNILDNVTKTNLQVDAEGTQQPRSYFLNDRRFALVLKVSI